VKKYFILTFGCQMNIYDSNLIASLIEKDGNIKAETIENADIIIVNTCAVREHAVNRVLSRIDSLKVLKKRKPYIRIGVTGCVPQQLKEKLLEEKPFIDFVLGPDNLRKITSCIKDKNGTFVKLFDTSLYSDLSPARGELPETFVSAMRGCNNFCSYCIVPYVRGKERSRHIEDILNEVGKLGKLGYKRVTFLGQNINNYKDRGKGLPYLLSEAAKVEGIERISFLTSHPAYFPLKVINVMKDEPKIEKFLHLPLQSGSSRILKAMNRGYTQEKYKGIIDKIRTKIEDIALSTDIIVGFPYETEKDFMETLNLVKMIDFDFAYMFKYSPRKYSLANNFIDTVNEETKRDRLNELIRVQSEVIKKKSEANKGKIFDVLITGENEKNYLASNGITLYNKRVIVKERICTGEIVKVRIEEVKGWTPIGTPVKEPGKNVALGLVPNRQKRRM